MNKKWLMVGGIAAVGVVGFVLYKRNAAPPADQSSSSDTNAYPLSYANGLGVISAAGVNGGETTSGSGLDALAAAMQGQSANDLQLGLAQTAAQKDIGLASIDATKTLGLADSANAYMHDVFGALPALAKAGISSIGGTTSSGNLMNAILTYTDQKKNIALAQGYNDKGDLIGSTATGQSIIKQSGQSLYDMAKIGTVTGKTYIAGDYLSKKDTKRLNRKHMVH